MTNLPKLYHLTLTENQIDMVGSGLSSIAAKIEGSLAEMLVQNGLICSHMAEIGPETYSEELRAVMLQVAKLKGYILCPKCSNYHSPEDQHALGYDPEVS